MINRKHSARSLLLLFLTIVMLVSGCAKANSKDIQVGSDANGKQIKLKQSENLAVRLESNPTTGYQWELSECDKSVLAPQGEPQYEAAKQNQPVVGGGGWETFRFKPQKVGQTHLKLIYHRTFEKDVPPAKTLELDVVVE